MTIEEICTELRAIHTTLYRIQYDFEDGRIWLYMPGSIMTHMEFEEGSRTRMLCEELLDRVFHG